MVAGIVLVSLLLVAGVQSARAQAVVAYVAVGDDPLSATVDSGNGDIYVTDSAYLQGNTSVSVVSGSTNKVLTTIPIVPGQYLRQATYDSTNGDIYVLNPGGVFGGPPSIFVISGSSNALIANVTACVTTGYAEKVCGGSTGVFDPSNGDLYFGAWGQIIILNGADNQILGNVTTPLGGPDGNLGVYDPGNGDVYFTSAGGTGPSPGSGIIVVSGGSLVASLPLSLSMYVGPPAYDPSNGNVYVYSPPSLLVISGKTNSLVANITVGQSGPGILTLNPSPIFDSDNGDVYVPVSTGLIGVSGTSNAIVANVTIPASPDGAALDPATHEIYVTSLFEDLNYLNYITTVVSDSSNSVVGIFDVGGTPLTPTYDSLNGNIYVSGYGSYSPGNMTVISGAAKAATSTSSTVPEFPVQGLAILSFAAIVTVVMVTRKFATP